MTTIDFATARRVLALPMQPNDADAATIRDYLIALLQQVWIHEEGFSGKRPFGNSGWTADLFTALVREGMVAGSFDEYDCLNYDGFDEDHANRLISAAIEELGSVAA